MNELQSELNMLDIGLYTGIISCTPGKWGTSILGIGHGSLTLEVEMGDPPLYKAWVIHFVSG